MKITPFILCCCLGLPLAAPAWARFEFAPFPFMASVEAIDDAEHFTATFAGQQVRVRLYGLAAPRLGQEYHDEALAALNSLLAWNDAVELRALDRDQSGHLVALATRGETNVNLEMVKAGAAWFDPRRCDDKNVCDLLAEAEKQARQNRRGLWAGHDPEPPWQWREGKR